MRGGGDRNVTTSKPAQGREPGETEVPAGTGETEAGRP